MAEGITNVEGEAVGDLMQDIDGLARGEVRDMVKAWLVVMLQLWC